MKVFKKLFTYFSVTAMSFMMFGNVAMASGSTPLFTMQSLNLADPTYTTLSPGDVLEGDFRVFNLDQNVSIDIMMDKNGYSNANYPLVMPKDWNQFSVVDINDLLPGTFVDVQYTLTIPIDAVPGKYAAILKAKLVDYDGNPQTGSGVQVFMAIGHTVYLEIIDDIDDENEHETDTDDETESNSKIKYIDWKNVKLERKYPFDIKDLTKPKYELKDYMIPKDDDEDEESEEESDDDNNKEKKSERKMSYKKAYKSKYRR